MNVRKTLFVSIAGACALLGGSMTLGQDPARRADVRDADVRVQPTQQPGRTPIQPPADRNRVKATYEIAGERVKVTEGEFYDCYERLEKLEPKNTGRLLDQNRVFEQILAVGEAKAFGLLATPEEVAEFDPLAKNPALAEQTWARYEKEKITKEMYATYQIEVRSIQKVKDLFANSMRVSSNDVFEAYRRDHFSIRLDYVEFPAESYAAELRAKPPTDDELKKYWEEDRAIQNQYRSQPTVTAEIVSFDPQATTPVTGSEREVKREEALAYYNQNKTRLDTLLRPDQRAGLQPAGSVDIKDLKTPFQMLRPVIEREIRLSGRIRAAFDDAKKPGADFAKLAAAAGLSYERIEKADREAMTTKYLRYGAQLFSVLSNHNPGDISPELRVEPQLQYFYRLIDREASKLPDFESVKAKLVAPYIETTSLSRAQKAAQAMRAYIDQKIDAEIRAEEEKMLAAAVTSAEAEIKAGNVTDAKMMEQIKGRHRATTLARVRQMKDSLAPKHFDQYVKDNALTVKDTGLFEAGNPRAGMSPEEQSRMRIFVKMNPTVKTMEVGQVTQIMTDAATKTHVIARMAQRAEPDYAKMTDGELLAIRSQTERAQSYQPVQRWQFADISRRRDLKME